MPTQVYNCPNCGEWERFLSFEEAVPMFQSCPKCGQTSPWRPSVPYKMLLDRQTRRKHSYPQEYDIP